MWYVTSDPRTSVRISAPMPPSRSRGAPGDEVTLTIIAPHADYMRRAPRYITGQLGQVVEVRTNENYMC